MRKMCSCPRKRVPIKNIKITYARDYLLLEIFEAPFVIFIRYAKRQPLCKEFDPQGLEGGECPRQEKTRVRHSSTWQGQLHPLPCNLLDPISDMTEYFEKQYTHQLLFLSSVMEPRATTCLVTSAVAVLSVVLPLPPPTLDCRKNA